MCGPRAALDDQANSSSSDPVAGGRAIDLFVVQWLAHMTRVKPLELQRSGSRSLDVRATPLLQVLAVQPESTPSPNRNRHCIRSSRFLGPSMIRRGFSCLEAHAEGFDSLHEHRQHGQAA